MPYNNLVSCGFYCRLLIAVFLFYSPPLYSLFLDSIQLLTCSNYCKLLAHSSGKKASFLNNLSFGHFFLNDHILNSICIFDRFCSYSLADKSFLMPGFRWDFQKFAPLQQCNNLSNFKFMATFWAPMGNDDRGNHLGSRYQV